VIDARRPGAVTPRPAGPPPGGAAFVSFVGAGPGDPELITLKGLRRLREAAVVVHDRLIPVELLGEVRADADVIDVGKEPGRHAFAQDAINRLIVERARARGRVVRLKGGDPAIFARLDEELEAVRTAGIAVEVVPGVTAATAGAAAAGCSLTARGGASLVVLATGTDRTGAEAAGLDWELLARIEGTLVFYMAARRLPAIVRTLTALGRDPGEPALVIEAAGTSAQRIVGADLGAIAEVAGRARIESPAIFISGPTAGLARASLGRLLGAAVSA
jgi:uroporphyrin-III C-methyltransferase